MIGGFSSEGVESSPYPGEWWAATLAICLSVIGKSMDSAPFYHFSPVPAPHLGLHRMQETSGELVQMIITMEIELFSCRDLSLPH